MKIKISGRKITVTRSLKSHIKKKLEKLDKYNGQILDINVVLSVEKNRQIAEMKLNFGGASVWGKESNVDMYAAVDMVLEKITRQLKKSRDKLKKRKKVSLKNFLIDDGEKEGEISESGKVFEEKKIIPSDRYEVKPIFPDDAAIKLESLNDAEFLVFTSAKTQKINVIFKRKDGNYGLIQPD